MPVQRLQGHAALEVAHFSQALFLAQNFGKVLLFVGVGPGGQIQDELNQHVALLAVKVGGLGVVRQREQLIQTAVQTLQIPLLGRDALRGVEVDVGLHTFREIRGDGLAQVGSLHDASALRVNLLALDVHDIVVVQGGLALVEVMHLDLLLGARDQAGEHLGVNRLLLSPALNQGRVGLVAEQSPQFVFQGDVKAGRAGIALAS